MSSSKKSGKPIGYKVKGAKKKKKMIEQVVSLLTGLFKKMLIEQVTSTSFYTTLESRLKQNPLFFMHIIYPRIRKRFEKLLDFDKFMELEKKILREISFLKGESYLYQFF